METVRIAAVQASPDLGGLEGTLSIVLERLESAAAGGAQLIVFPETFLPWYPYFSLVTAPIRNEREHLRLYANAVEVPGRITDAISDAARSAGAVVVVGVNERDRGSLYNTQLVFDADGRLVLKRRKIMPTFHERMIWGQGDGSGLQVVETAVGRIGALACWEHYNPLARFALMAQHEEIHVSQFPGSLLGQVFADQIEVALRNHALESGCFVVNATAWLHEDQTRSIAREEKLRVVLQGGCMTAIISPEGQHVVPPLTEGEGLLMADVDMKAIRARKRMMDCVGHYGRPDLLALLLNQTETSSTVVKANYEGSSPVVDDEANRPRPTLQLSPISPLAR